MGTTRGNSQPDNRQKTRHVPLAIGTGRLAVPLGLFEDGRLPTEFRLFKKGINPTEIGDFLFDDAAAAMTMDAYRAHGVDKMIDLEHLSLNPEAQNYDPDARASCKLELRDGELWAVDVKWTEDGARRLNAKTQRYISPAFLFDEQRRVTKIGNMALTAMPATHDTAELVAASVAATQQITTAHLAVGASSMDPTLVKKALDALTAGDADAAMSILAEMIASAAGGEVEAELDPEMLAEGDPPADEGALAEGDPPVEKGALAEGDPPADEEEAAASIAAGISQLMTLTGEGNLLSAVLSARDTIIDTQKFQRERAAFELGRRRDNAIKLQKLGAETPATSGLNVGKLCARLLTEDLAEQDKRLAALLAARGGKLPVDPKSPSGPNPGRLTPEELAICASSKCDPQTYAQLKAQFGTG